MSDTISKAIQRNIDREVLIKKTTKAAQLNYQQRMATARHRIEDIKELSILEDEFILGIDNEALLLAGLRKQVIIMNENAELLKKVKPDLGHHVELFDAAKITKTWVDGIVS
ncbi:MAG: hypothetical protein QM500_14410 [Methylococcales bacterium]